jgi:hypothetical protein
MNNHAGFITSTLVTLFGLLCCLPVVFLDLIVRMVVILTRGRRASPATIPASQTAAPVAQPPKPAAEEAQQSLKQLKQILDNGLITRDEYEAKKAEILKRL